MPVLEIKNLSHRYPERRPGRGKAKDTSATTSLPALQDVSFSVEAGEIFGLLGPNGGGKTTLFRIVSTYFPPTSGQAFIFGKDVNREPDEVRKDIGVIFQAPSLDKKLTVRENLTHQGHLYGLSGQLLKDRIAEVLARLGLADRAEDIAETLSGGLQRRVEIAKGMLHKPKLLLMDEPSTGLDPGARKDLWDYLADLKKEGMTICVTTHLMEEAEKCDRLAILNLGKLVALDTPDALKSEIGGDVITVEAKNPSALVEQIRKKFNCEAELIEQSIRIEKDSGHEFIPQLVQSFPNEITSVRLGKPTLEDVFIHRTGHKFWQMNANA